ncbi:MAG TPA: S-methyl-5'-thioinosine phosphorylase [Gammaproteobacteria bacterium]|nr:S-methyl-5'-thioinosine phosphorylase [Gammaproteobacteria bacterium]
MLGIIGGTGLDSLDGMDVELRQAVSTPWGDPSAPLLCGRLAGHEVTFLARHGGELAIAPHEVNYRANIWALREAGVDRVIAVNAVGGINDEFAPGMLAVPDQLIDYSWGRAHSFCGAGGQPLRHVDFTTPYSRSMRAELLAAAARAGLAVRDGGVYAVTQGPRLETAAEVDRLARDGCHVVGMTGMPEAGLARELGLEYACCAVIVNRAAGRGSDIHGELARWVEQGMVAARRLLHAVIAAPGSA